MTLSSLSITVSGFPPIPAFHTVVGSKGACLSSAPMLPRVMLHKCNGCGDIDYFELQGGLCPTCARRQSQASLALHGRVPGAGEFFCPKCQLILPLTLLYRGDMDARRLVCHPCRRLQWQKAKQNQKQRKGGR